MKRFVVFIVIIAVVFSTLAFAACSSPAATTDDTATAAEGDSGDTAATTGGEFKVGMECNYAPFNWTQTEEADFTVPIPAGGYAGGYDVEIAKRVAEGLGKELVIVKTEWDGLIPALDSGKIDAVIAGMSPTEERKVTVDFSDPYYESDLVVVVKKDGPYAGATSLEDFDGAKITGQLNTFHYSVIDQIPNVQKQTAMPDFPSMIVALQSGKIDGYVSERPGAVSASASNPDITFVSFDEGNGFEASPEDVAIAVAVKKGNTVVTDINEILGGISKEDRQKLMDDAIDNQPIVVEE